MATISNSVDLPWATPVATGQRPVRVGVWIFTAEAWCESLSALRELGIEPDYSTSDGPRVFAGRTAYVAYSEAEIESLVSEAARWGIDAAVVRLPD